MPHVPPDLNEIHELYLDESSHTAHRYLVIGGLAIHAPRRDELEAEILKARLPELPAMEIGWVKVSRAKLPAYKRVVDLFFDNKPGFSPFHFHALVVDTHKQNHRLYNEGSGEIGFNKEVYQLCSKFARLYGDKLFHVFPDKRPNPSSPEDLRLVLNRGRAKKKDPREWPFRRVHPKESRDWQTLQLVDVLMGALAFKLNGHADKEGASPAKCELSTHVLERAQIKDVMADTAMSGKFTIWHRQLREGVAGP